MAGKTYRFRISNIGSSQTLNFRIEGHQLLLVETEGSYVESTYHDSLDVHLGQSYSVLVTMDQNDRDYYVVASTRFASPVLNGIGVLHYADSTSAVSGDLPPAPADPDFSLNQARSITWNLTTNAARPNPQGSYHYGNITITNSVKFSNSAPTLSGKQRFAINNVSHFVPDTPLKLADYYHIPNVFTSVPLHLTQEPTLAVSVLEGPFRAFVEVIFQNDEPTIQSWHTDGYSFWVVGFGSGEWNETARLTYNLRNAVSRSTTHVYPSAWTAVLMSLDNPGLWNIRSAEVQRQYLGQELYLRVVTPPGVSWKRREHAPPVNLLLCGQAKTLQVNAASPSPGEAP
ncbi:hypothetical protein M758_1G134500 [Ceratodon purpureus]|nr:hypothetical protein M758_1G134500 [Ceratodon purpureus]